MNYRIRLLGYSERKEFPGGYFGTKPDPDEPQEWMRQHPHFVVELLEQTSEETFRVNHWAIHPDLEGPFTNPRQALSILGSILPPPDYWNMGDAHFVHGQTSVFSDGSWSRYGNLAKTFEEFGAEMDKYWPPEALGTDTN